MPGELSRCVTSTSLNLFKMVLGHLLAGIFPQGLMTGGGLGTEHCTWHKTVLPGPASPPATRGRCSFPGPPQAPSLVPLGPTDLPLVLGAHAGVPGSSGGAFHTQGLGGTGWGLHLPGCGPLTAASPCSTRTTGRNADSQISTNWLSILVPVGLWGALAILMWGPFQRSPRTRRGAAWASDSYVQSGLRPAG